MQGFNIQFRDLQMASQMIGLKNHDRHLDFSTLVCLHFGINKQI